MSVLPALVARISAVVPAEPAPFTSAPFSRQRPAAAVSCCSRPRAKSSLAMAVLHRTEGVAQKRLDFPKQQRYPQKLAQ